MATRSSLDGTVVADFSRVLAGPYATMLLADLGADVIKVERPGAGDDTRAWGPPYTVDGMSTYFAGVNRNKRSVALDLKDPRDRDAALALARRADVVVENFPAGTMDRLGLGFTDIAAVNPGAVYCSITGFGAGSGAAMPGYDLLVQAVGGLMSITGSPGGEPTKVGVALVDVLTGLHATVGILAALHQRRETGVGQHVEVDLLSSLLSGMVNQSAAFAGAGVVPRAMGNAHPSIAPYELFEARDRGLILAVGNDGQFAKLAAAIELPGLADDPLFATNYDRVLNRELLKARIEEALRGRDAAQWEALLTRAGVPCGPVNTIAEAFALADRLGLNRLVEVREGERASAQVADPIRMSASTIRYDRVPPLVGEHTEEVLAWLE